MKNFASRLKMAIERSGKAKSALAEHCGVASPAVSRWINGSEPRAETMAKIADFLGVNVKWLMFGEDQPGAKVKIEGSKFNESDKSRMNPSSRTIPVLGWAHAGDAMHYEEIPPSWQETVPTDCRDQKAFAVRLEGDSMEPKFYEGDILILQPGEEIYNGCLAILKMRSDGYIFRRVEIRPDCLRLIPLNPQWGVEEISKDEIAWAYPVWGMVRKIVGR